MKESSRKVAGLVNWGYHLAEYCMAEAPMPQVEEQQVGPFVEEVVRPGLTMFGEVAMRLEKAGISLLPLHHYP